MSVSASRVKRHVDAAEPITLRPLSSGAVTGTTLEPAISLNRLAGVLPGVDAVVPHGIIAVAINVASLNLSTNTYSLELLTDSVEAMNADPEVLLSVPLTAVGPFEVGLDTSNVPAGHEWLAARLVVGGTPDAPSIDYAAWLVQSRAA